MPKKKRRDNSYYRAHLKRHYPSIYAALEAGRIKNVRQARIAAKLLKEPTALDALKKAWNRAKPSDRDDFDRWRERLARSGVGELDLILGPDRKVTKASADALSAFMKTNSIKPGRISKEMGLKALDPSVGNALARHRSPTRDFIEKLNAAVRRLTGR
jgi:hypothetical protein